MGLIMSNNSGVNALKFPTGLEGYWNCNETVTPLLDSAEAHNLDYVGAPTSVRGKFDLAHAGFVDNTAYFRGNHSADWALTGGANVQQATIEAWVKFVNTGAGGIQIIFQNTASNYQGQNDCLRFGMMANDQFGGGIPLAFAFVNPSSYVDDDFHYVVLICDNTLGSARTKLYIDNVHVASNDNNSTYTQAEGYISIGADDINNQNWEGTIDDVAFWPNSTMTLAQMNARYNGGKGRIYAAVGRAI